MDTKILETILAQLTLINANINRLNDRLDGYMTDLRDFSDRFDEVVTTLEQERRLDMIRDSYN